jgi:hypothetical protein
MQNFVLAFEIKINRAVGNSRLSRNVSYFRIEVTFLGENFYCRAQNRFPFIGDTRRALTIYAI